MELDRLSHPLNPEQRRQESTKSEGTNPLYFIACIVLIVFIGVAAALIYIGTNDSGSSNTAKRVEVGDASSAILNGATNISLGDYDVCDWEFVTIQSFDGIQITVDGNQSLEYNVTRDAIVIEGVQCGTNNTARLALDDAGLHGIIEQPGGADIKVQAQDPEHSTLTVISSELDEDLKEDNVTNEVRENLEDWKKLLDQMKSQPPRRLLQSEGEPEEVEIKLHLEIEGTMVSSLDGPVNAAKYALELIGIISRDIYSDANVKLKVVSMNLMKARRYYYYTKDKKKYLDMMKAPGYYHKPVPQGAHALLFLTTRLIKGGVAPVAGMYTAGSNYAVVGNLKENFDRYDRAIIAHELGHLLGLLHTHEYSDPPDTCGADFDNYGYCNAPRNGKGTLMSECNKCTGGMDNVVLKFHEKMIPYLRHYLDLYKESLATPGATECNPFAGNFLPRNGEFFYLKAGGEALTVDAGSCEECAHTIAEGGYLSFGISSSKQIIQSYDNPDYCWTAKKGECNLYLDLCESPPDYYSNKWIERKGNLWNPNCQDVTHTGTTVDFGGDALEVWCYPDWHPGMVPVFDEGETTLQCNSQYYSTTVGTSEGKKIFKFVAPQGKAVSFDTCDSELSTILYVRPPSMNGYTATSTNRDWWDADGCGSMAENNMIAYLDDLVPGDEYTIQLEGWCKTVGSYRFAITCHDSLTPPAPPAETPTGTFFTKTACKERKLGLTGYWGMDSCVGECVTRPTCLACTASSTTNSYFSMMDNRHGCTPEDFRSSRHWSNTLWIKDDQFVQKTEWNTLEGPQ